MFEKSKKNIPLARTRAETAWVSVIDRGVTHFGAKKLA